MKNRFTALERASIAGMDAQEAREQLREHAWTTPQHYAGFSPIGDYLLASVHRESDTVDRSNWQCIARDFGAVDWSPSRDEYQWNAAPDGPEWRKRPSVYVWRAGHCLVGWVDYMMVRADAPDNVLADAAEALAALSDYPIYCEDHWSELEYTEACEFWEASSVADRVEYCRDAGISIFAARRDCFPDDPSGYLLEALRG